MNNKFDALKTEGDSGEDSNGETQTKGAAASAGPSTSKDPQQDQTEPEVVPGPGEHPLQFKYTLWFSRRPSGKQATPISYDQHLKKVSSFASVEQFWRIFSHLVRPGDLTGHSDYHIFKYGIRPMWEDEANRNGGKWIVRLRKGLASRCWENLILAILGEQFMVGEEICGAVISLRYQEDILSLWNKTSKDSAITTRIRDTLRRVLNLPPNTIMEYKSHTDSLRNLESDQPHRTFSQPYRGSNPPFRGSNQPFRSNSQHFRNYGASNHQRGYFSRSASHTSSFSDRFKND